MSIAPHGQKTIKATIYFFTDGLAPEGEINPGHGWAGGTINVRTNSAHGVKDTTRNFNRMAEIPLKLEEALEAAGVTLHIGPPSNKLYK